MAFEEPFITPPVSQQVFEALGGRPEILAARVETREGVNIKVAEKKMLVSWNPTGCRITMENISDRDHCLKMILSSLQRIDSVAPIGKLSVNRFFTHWILPTPKYDFVSLERKYREAMIVPSDITRGTYDSSIILDIKVGKLTLHHQSGVMEPKQLHKSYLKYKLDNIPEVFLFLEASIQEDKVVQYADEEMKSFLASSMEICNSHSEVFNKFWEGLL